uniref:Putative regulatory protein n=2 Tax=Nonomuraea gerenzanensis TaxID=93944 RepID=A0A1M4ED13_9ACTN|nr:Putative regulatory protein [Nonomuraea gerenzanensis]
MWEIVNSLQALQAGYGKSALRDWRRSTAHALYRIGLAGRVRDRLFTIAPHATYFPDLLTPVEGGLGLEEALEAVLSTPRTRLRAEMAPLEGAPGAASWLDDLSAGRPRALAELGETLTAYYRGGVEPHWDLVRASVDGDLVERRQSHTHGGVHALLDGLRPMASWRFPVLEIAGHPSDRDVHLKGRGLLLIPSYFCRLHPVTIFNGALPQVLVFPVRRPDARVPPGNAAATGRLLGDTRAAVLRAVGAGSTTSDLARRLGVTPATISHHTGVLRDAGLIRSRRSATTVTHSLTSLGWSLLHRGGHDRGATWSKPASGPRRQGR